MLEYQLMREKGREGDKETEIEMRERQMERWRENKKPCHQPINIERRKRLTALICFMINSMSKALY
jgi:hypothetical protein